MRVGGSSKEGESGAAATFTAAIVVVIAEAGAGVPSQDVHLCVRPRLRQSRCPAATGQMTADGDVTKRCRSNVEPRIRLQKTPD